MNSRILSICQYFLLDTFFLIRLLFYCTSRKSLQRKSSWLYEMPHKRQGKSANYSLRMKPKCISVKIMCFLMQCRLPEMRYTQKALMWNRNAETRVTMDNSQVASCQNFLMSIQSASNLDLYFSPWESHYVSKGKTILKFNKQEHICKNSCYIWLCVSVKGG